MGPLLTEAAATNRGNENDPVDLNRLQPRFRKDLALSFAPPGLHRYDAGFRGLTPPATQCRPFGTIFGAVAHAPMHQGTQGHEDCRLFIMPAR